MIRRLALLLFVATAGCTTTGQVRWSDDSWVESLLAERPSAFGRYLSDPEAHRLQILVSEVREVNGETHLVRHGYRLGAEYFYPASTIKLCAAVAALEWLNGLEGAALPDATSPMTYHPLFPDESLDDADPSNLDGGSITIGHEIRKLFIVSDNRAFNRLYELVGQLALNESMWAAGLDSTRCIHRLSEFRSYEDNRRVPRIELALPSGETYVVPERESELELDSSHVPRLRIGDEHVEPGTGRLTDGPMDFTRKNSISLEHLQDALIRLIHPELVPEEQRFDLTPAQLDFLREALSQLPRESDNPRYDPERHGDDRYKYLRPGIARIAEIDGIRIYNKVGRAYGFSIENAYVVDETTGRAFYLAAVLYTNPNATVNDGDYGYAELANPFFADLGEAVAERLLRDAKGAGAATDGR